MLPRADGARVADIDGLFFNQRADGVRHDAVCRIIAAADDVAGADGDDRAELRVRREKRAIPRLRHQFGRALAHRINIMAAERVVFAIGKFPLAIVIALVARDDDGDAVQFQFANGFEDVRRADARWSRTFPVVRRRNGERWVARRDEKRLAAGFF